MTTALALYAASIPILLGGGGARFTMGSIIPIVAIGWAYGAKAGIIAGIAGYAFNTLIVWVILGTPDPVLTSFGAGVGSAVSTAVAWTVGYLAEARETALRHDDFVTSMLVEAFEHSPVGMAIMSPSGGFELVNPAFVRMFGRPRRELQAMNWFSLVNMIPNMAERQTIAALLQNPVGSLEFDVEYRTSEGEDRHGRAFLSSIEAKETQVGYVLVQLKDTTELRRANAELQKIIEFKDNFIASISHELRTPLTAVAGLAREIRDHIDDFSREQLVDFAEIMSSQSTELEHIVDDFLVHVRAESDTLRVLPVPVDLAAATETAIATSGLDMDIPVLVHPDEPIKASADEMRLRQILRNLLQNAIRYGSDPIRIEIGADATSCWLKVIDSGDGVPESDEGDLFEPHKAFHADQGLTESLGLGLHISRTLARLMGGDITYSRRDGETHFELSLPKASPQ